MNTKKIFALCIMFLFSVVIVAQDSNDKTRDKANSKNESGMGKDMDMAAEFVKEAASGGMMEVELGKIAQKKGSSKEVKDFGALMVKDHSKANDELKAAAKKANITVPGKLMDEHKKHIDEMSKLSGKEFDEAYLDMMVDDHEKDISKFEDASEDIKVAEIKNFASKTLPVLKQHRQKLEQITKNMDSISRSNDDKQK